MQEHDSQEAKALPLLKIHFYQDFSTKQAWIKKDPHNFMAINSTTVKQAKSVLQGI